MAGQTPRKPQPGDRIAALLFALTTALAAVAVLMDVFVWRR